VIFKHCPRKANMAADLLASKADGSLLIGAVLSDVSMFPNLI
jgi:hypothetical protein